MEDLVTLQQARDHLRIDNDADDAWLATWIPAISQAIGTWLKDEWRAYELSRDADGELLLDSSEEPIPLEDSNGPIVKSVVTAACLVELAQQFRYRDGSEAAAVHSHWGHGYVLGAGATSLLSGLRKSTLA
jgi:hypothetical protein